MLVSIVNSLYDILVEYILFVISLSNVSSIEYNDSKLDDADMFGYKISFLKNFPILYSKDIF